MLREHSSSILTRNAIGYCFFGFVNDSSNDMVFLISALLLVIALRPDLVWFFNSVKNKGLQFHKGQAENLRQLYILETITSQFGLTYYELFIYNKLFKFFYLFLSRMYLAINFIIKFIDWTLNFIIKTPCDEKKWVYRDPLSQIRFCLFISTKRVFKNWT